MHRNKWSKWFVTKEEYKEAKYPDYCSGWAYVTNHKTVKSILEESKKVENHFWIDDVYITGILRKLLPSVKLFDWSMSFLRFVGTT